MSEDLYWGKIAKAIHEMGRVSAESLNSHVRRAVTFADIKDRCMNQGFLFAHAREDIPGRVLVLVVSVLVNGNQDLDMLQRERNLVEDFESTHTAGVEIVVHHHSVTGQQLAALQSLVRLAGADEACAQIFGKPEARP